MNMTQEEINQLQAYQHLLNTDKEVSKLSGQVQRKDLALEAVLLFHSGTHWDVEKVGRWSKICSELLGPSRELTATTRKLCDLVRAALKES